MSYNNIGAVYNSLGEDRSALEYHKKALGMQKAIYRVESNHTDIAMSYTIGNQGRVYYSLGEYRSALNYYN